MMGQSGRLAGRRWGWLVALGGALAVLALQGGRPQAAQAAGCDFQRGFAALRAAIVATAGEDVVGACLESEWHRGNGDAEQATEGGVFFWEKEHNHTWFTDGSQAWSWGPQGLTQQPLAALAAAGGDQAPRVVNGCEITAFTNCPGWDLRGADLHGANLSHANLSGADLFQANLTGAELLRASLSRADLREANLSGATMLKTWLSGAKLNGAKLGGAKIYAADLSATNLTGADLNNVDLRDTDLSEANVSGANLGGASLSGANLGAANLSTASLVGASLLGANLSGANLSGANLSGANLFGASLTRASLSDANLSGARCWRTTWTDGSVRAPDQPGPCQ